MMQLHILASENVLISPCKHDIIPRSSRKPYLGRKNTDNFFVVLRVNVQFIDIKETIEKGHTILTKSTNVQLIVSLDFYPNTHKKREKHKPLKLHFGLYVETVCHCFN